MSNAPRKLTAGWVLCLLLASLPAAAEWLSGEQAIMGTAIKVELWHTDADAGRAAIAAVMDEMHRIDRLMSPFKPESELSLINRDAAQRPVNVSRELFDLLARSLEFSKRTNGAFDITFSSVGYLYDYRRGVKPSAAEIKRKLPAINYRHVQLDSANTTVKFAYPGVRIDLGGIGKGYAVDTSIAVLKQRGIAHALVSAGGDSRVLGDRLGRPWRVGIRDPRRRDGVVAVIPLVDAAISTSGDYERYFEADGVRYHHILNPKTGRSPTEVHSVTIIGTEGTTTDALTKGVFVLGVDAGIKLIESFPGLETVIIDASGRMHFSSGLRHLVPTPVGSITPPPLSSPLP